MNRVHWRRAAIISAAAPAALLLSGCLSLATTVVVNSDATASGEFSLAVARSPAALLGIASADALIGALSDSGQADFTSATDCVASEDESFLRLTCPFENQTFTDPTDLLLIQREGDQMTVTIRSEGQSDEEIDVAIGTLTVEVQTPGPIRSITGQYATQTGDDTARIAASLSDDVAVTITSDATGSVRLPWLPILLGFAALLALAVIVVLLVLVLRRRSATPAPNPTSPDLSTSVEPTVPPNPWEGSPPSGLPDPPRDGAQ